jgi:hypothetical protein
VYFGSIYGTFLCGAVGIYTLLNLMSGETSIGFLSVVSIMGYGLLPVVGLAAFAIVWSLKGVIGSILGSVVIFWSTHTSSRFFEKALGMNDRRLLIMYPSALFYACFVLMTVF